VSTNTIPKVCIFSGTEVEVLISHIVPDPDSNDGRYLLLRTEFHGQCEYRTTTAIARRAKENPDIPQSKLLMGP